MKEKLESDDCEQNEIFLKSQRKAPKTIQNSQRIKSRQTDQSQSPAELSELQNIF